jgi:leucyl-tRNA synthetase
MSNHLSFLIYHNALLFTPEYWPKNITIGGLLIKDGNKISKSKGNGIPLIKVREMWGADLYRLYVAVGTSYDSEFDFREEEIVQLEKKFSKWKELLFTARAQQEPNYEDLETVDKWLISRFYTRAEQYFSLMDDMKSREAYVSILYEFLSEINYHTRRTSEEQTSKVLRFFFADYAKLMTPVVPHVCEELLNGDASLAEFQTLSQNYIDAEVEAQEGIVQELLAEIHRKIGFAKTKNQEVTAIEIQQATAEKFELFDELKLLLEKNTPPKEIMGTLMANYGKTQAKFIKNFVPKTFGGGIHMYFTKEVEGNLISQALPFFSSTFDVPLSISEAEGNGPKPGRPAVHLLFE